MKLLIMHFSPISHSYDIKSEMFVATKFNEFFLSDLLLFGEIVSLYQFLILQTMRPKRQRFSPYRLRISPQWHHLPNKFNENLQGRFPLTALPYLALLSFGRQYDSKYEPTGSKVVEGRDFSNSVWALMRTSKQTTKALRVEHAF